MGSYPTLFTLTVKTAVWFLWYFPYPYGRSPLATTLLCVARTFLLVTQAIAFQALLDYIMKESKLHLSKDGSLAPVGTGLAPLILGRNLRTPSHGVILILLCANSVFAVATRSVMLNVFNNLRSNIATGNFFDAKTWRSINF